MEKVYKQYIEPANFTIFGSTVHIFELPDNFSGNFEIYEVPYNDPNDDDYGIPLPRLCLQASVTEKPYGTNYELWRDYFTKEILINSFSLPRKIYYINSNGTPNFPLTKCYINVYNKSNSICIYNIRINHV